jgi:MHS family proline/betaine transporter-like MFS transporter
MDTSNLISSFSVYGVAFLMRPVGGLTIGYVGDKYGRKQALVLSLFLMAFPTFLMGCLPTYEQVGAVSTISLVVCRMLQGMSVGGQLPASLIYTVEMRPKASWGYYGALVMSKSLTAFRFIFKALDLYRSK